MMSKSLTVSLNAVAGAYNVLLVGIVLVFDRRETGF